MRHRPTARLPTCLLALRAYVWLHEQAEFPAEGDDRWQPHLINARYGTELPAETPAQVGKNMGWTDWTHVRP